MSAKFFFVMLFNWYDTFKLKIKTINNSFFKGSINIFDFTPNTAPASQLFLHLWNSTPLLLQVNPQLRSFYC